MSRFLKIASFALLLLGLQFQVVFAAPTKVDVLNVDAAYRAARKADDVKKLESMLAPDFIAVHGNGDVMSRAEFLAWVGAHKGSFQKWGPPSELKVHITGNTAVVTALSDVSGKFELHHKVEQLALTGRATRTWVHTPQGWKLAVMQWLSVTK